MVIELIRPERPGLGGDLPRPADHGRDQLRRDALWAGDQLDLSAECLHCSELLAGEGIRRDDVQWVAFHRADEGERRAGASSAVLDDRLTGFQAAIPLGGFDHGQRHSILVRACWVGRLQLHPHLGILVAGQPIEPNDRSVADAADTAHETLP